MKRIVLLFAAVCILLGGCASGPADADVNEISEALEKALHFVNLIDVHSDGLSSYFHVPAEALDDFVFKTSDNSDSSADAYGVFLCKDESALSSLNTAVADYLKQRNDAFLSASPKEYEKLKNMVLRKQDRLLVFVVCEQSETANEVLAEYFTPSAK